MCNSSALNGVLKAFLFYMVREIKWKQHHLATPFTTLKLLAGLWNDVFMFSYNFWNLLSIDFL